MTSEAPTRSWVESPRLRFYGFWLTMITIAVLLMLGIDYAFMRLAPLVFSAPSAATALNGASKLGSLVVAIFFLLRIHRATHEANT